MTNQSKNGKAGIWKVAIFLPVLALLLMAFGREGEKEPMAIKSSQVESPSIMGTWKLVAYSYGGTWEDLKPVPTGSERIKFITEKNFNWIQYTGKDKIVVNSAGGSYTYSGNDYTEKIEFGGQGMAGYIGKEHKFKVSIHKDKMEMSGDLAYGLNIKEVWVRYQPSNETSMNNSTISPYIDRMFIYLMTDGKFRYNSDQTQLNASELEEKLKSELVRNPKLQVAVLIEEGKIDERVNQLKEIINKNGNPEVNYSHLHIQKGETDSNGNQSAVWISKPIDIK
jgi:hypothetical protein